MIKYKVSIILIICLALNLGACSKEGSFDATGYVQSTLDAVYHGKYESYAEFLDVSEKEAKSTLEKNFDEQIQQEFDGFDGITEEGIAKYGEMMKKVKSLAKYKVLDAEQTDEGGYVVKVQVEPANIYQTLEQSCAEVSNEKNEQGLTASDPEVFASVLNESIQKSIDQNTYGKVITVDVTVTKEDYKTYCIKDTELNKVNNALFPG